jgi:translation initiation factor IF-2
VVRAAGGSRATTPDARRVTSSRGPTFTGAPPTRSRGSEPRQATAAKGGRPTTGSVAKPSSGGKSSGGGVSRPSAGGKPSGGGVSRPAPNGGGSRPSGGGGSRPRVSRP